MDSHGNSGMSGPPSFHPIGTVHCGRSEPIDDNWDSLPAIIELDERRFAADALLGLDTFSHVEILYLFHLVDESDANLGARNPRGRKEWPKVGIFAQRGKERPNRIGATICRVEKVEGVQLHVSGLDAVDGSPVLDIKPVMKSFLPRGELREPDWCAELMRDYW